MLPWWKISSLSSSNCSLRLENRWWRLWLDAFILVVISITASISLPERGAYFQNWLQATITKSALFCPAIAPWGIRNQYGESWNFSWLDAFILVVISLRFIRTWSTFSARRSYEVVGALAMKWGKEEGKSRWGWWVSLGELLRARALSHAVLRARVYPSSMPTKLHRFNFFLSPIAYPISQVREVSGSCAKTSGGWNCIRSGATKKMILWDLGLQFALALSFTVI